MTDDEKQMTLPGVPVSELRTIESSPDSVMVMLSTALSGGTNVADLTELFALHERVTAQQARKEFGVAMAAFKAACPPVPRRKENAQFKVNRNGQNRNARYAALEDIEATIRGPLGENGLSFRWESGGISDDHLATACVVSHIGGHAERSEVFIPIASKAGSSDQQKMGSAYTYGQRFSLIQALGLTTCEEDVDGNSGESAATISDDQAIALRTLIDEVGGDEAKLLLVYGAKSIEEMMVANFRPAVDLLEAKRK